MPKIPVVQQRRVMCTTKIKKVDDQWWVRAYDQGGNRYPECDFSTDTYEEAREIARKRINKSYTTQK